MFNVECLMLNDKRNGCHSEWSEESDVLSEVEAWGGEGEIMSYEL